MDERALQLGERTIKHLLWQFSLPAIIDGSNIKSSNVSETNPNEILAISSAEIHVLSKGYGFDLKRREVLRLH
jgi:cyanophycinase-like exopeptidase